MTTTNPAHSTTEQHPRALIVVDAQQGFIADAPNSEQALHHIHQLLDSPQFDVVIATRFINPEDSVFRRVLDWHDMSQGSTGTTLDERVERRADRIIDKYGYGVGVLDMDTMFDLLHAHDVDSAVIVGFDTDACVLAVAFSLFDRGIAPYIDSRGCDSGGGAELHKAALSIAERSLQVL